MSDQTKPVSETEFAILNVLWDRGSASVREIVEEIYDEHTHSLHTSVKSLLQRLSSKGYVVREQRGTGHFFSATVDREKFVAQQLQRLADNNFGGSLTPLLLTLVEHVELNRQDRAMIRKIIDKIN